VGLAAVPGITSMICRLAAIVACTLTCGDPEPMPLWECRATERERKRLPAGR
jgi:hypothetical protein